MRLFRLSLCASVMLVLATGARAQTPVLEKVVPDQMERGVSLSSPALAPPPRDVTKDLQAELKRVGCFEGAVDGVWGDVSRTALAEFARRAKLDVAVDAATATALDAVKSRRDRICPLDCGPARIERNGQCVARAAPTPEAKPAPRPTAETRRAPREKPDNESSGSGMCWRNDGRGTSLVPCSEAPTGRRAY